MGSAELVEEISPLRCRDLAGHVLVPTGAPRLSLEGRNCTVQGKCLAGMACARKNMNISFRQRAMPEQDVITRAAMWFEDAEGFGPLLDMIGDAEVVLIGEASHGTEEFYRTRAELTRALITRKGFNVV